MTAITQTRRPWKLRLALLGELAHSGRTIAVLGEMRELGKTEGLLHQQVGEFVATHGVDVLIACGKLGMQNWERGESGWNGRVAGYRRTFGRGGFR